MKIPSNLADKLIYFDPGFIAAVYEQETNESPTTQISNAVGFDGKLNVAVAGFGTSIKETKTYTISSFQMLKVVQTVFEAYPNFAPSTFDSSRNTQTCWIKGTLTIGEWSSGDGASKSVSQTFELMVENERQTLIVQRDLFRSGIGFLTEMESALSLNMNIPITVLGRVLFVNPTAKCHLTCPYLIFES